MFFTYFLKRFFVLSCIVCLPFWASAQFEEFEQSRDTSNKRSNTPILEKLVFGGSFEFAFADMAYISVEPQVGYLFNEYFTAGIIGTYSYYSYTSWNYSYECSQNIYGGGVFVDFHPLRFLVAHVDIQALNFKRLFNTSYFIDEGRIWDMPILFGAGYHMSIGRKGCVNYMLLWNLNNTDALKNNVYTNPIIKVSIFF